MTPSASCLRAVLSLSRAAQSKYPSTWLDNNQSEQYEFIRACSHLRLEKNLSVPRKATLYHILLVKLTGLISHVHLLLINSLMDISCLVVCQKRERFDSNSLLRTSGDLRYRFLEAWWEGTGVFQLKTKQTVKQTAPVISWSIAFLWEYSPIGILTEWPAPVLFPVINISKHGPAI